MEGSRETLGKVALKIIFSAKTDLYLKMRFFHIGLGYLEAINTEDLTSETTTLGTDAKHLFYNPKWLISMYQQDKNLINRTLIHLLLHCIYKHVFFKSLYINEKLWWVSCDIFTEKLIDDLNLDYLKRKGQEERTKIYDYLSTKKLIKSSNDIYHILLENDEYDLSYLASVFYLDDHRWWLSKSEKESLSKDNDGNNGSNYETPQTSNNDRMDTSNKEDKRDSKLNSENHLNRKEQEKTEIHWHDIAAQISLDLDSFNKSIGTENSFMKTSLKVLLKEKHNYKEMLKQFMVPKEIYKEDLDAFDPIYYTFGLNYYGNMPLIEYLEYKEVKVIDELVIIIDTSGSTQGQLIQNFIEETYSIIQQTTPSNLNYKIVIIQADNKVQDVQTINNQKELKEYMNNFTVYGMGGTDFRPGFDKVDNLIKNKALTRLKGILYFTDGYGIYPESRPPYETMFVFYDDDYNNYQVPLWASKIVISEDDLK
ncbi:MAG: VWA-like domain-containing protein [Candidatus Izemoplasmataceae bacterium]